MKKALILLADGCEEMEAVTIIDILRRGEISVTIASLGDKQMITGAHQIDLATDTTLEAILPTAHAGEFDVIVMPGGLPGTTHLLEDPRVKTLLQKQAARSHWVAAICAAPLVLAQAGLLDNKSTTVYPGCIKATDYPSINITEEAVVVADNVITGRSPGTAIDFALQLVDALVGAETCQQVEAGLVR